MTTPKLQTEDAVVQQVLTSLDNHMAAMLRAGQNVENIKGEIQQHFRAACSTAYQQKVEDWESQYRNLQNAYHTFQEKLAAGHRQINSAHDDALQTGYSWNAGDHVYTSLGG